MPKRAARLICRASTQQPAKADKLPSVPEDGDDEAPHADAALSNSRPGLPVTEGEFPIAHSPEPETAGEQAAPDSDSDSDATTDYEGKGLSSEDEYYGLTTGQSFPDMTLLDSR